MSQTYTCTEMATGWRGTPEWHIIAMRGRRVVLKVICKAKVAADLECHILRERGFTDLDDNRRRS